MRPIIATGGGTPCSADASIGVPPRGSGPSGVRRRIIEAERRSSPHRRPPAHGSVWGFDGISANCCFRDTRRGERGSYARWGSASHDRLTGSSKQPSSAAGHDNAGPSHENDRHDSGDHGRAGFSRHGYRYPFFSGYPFGYGYPYGYGSPSGYPGSR